MDPTSVIYEAEFRLPPEFLTDEDFHVEKENKRLFDLSHGFDSFRFNSGLGSFGGDKDDFLAGLTRQMAQSSLEDDFSGGPTTFPAVYGTKAWGSSQSTLCEAGVGCGCRNQPRYENRQPRVSSRAAWDLYCTAAEGAGKMNTDGELYGYNNLSGRGHLNLPRKHSPAAAADYPNHQSGRFSHHHSLPYKKLQAIQFQQLKQHQLMKHRRQLLQQSRGVRNKNGEGLVDLSPSAWSNHQPHRPVFNGDQAGKRGSTGTGVFLPRRVNRTSPATTKTRKKPSLAATVYVPPRVAQVLNLNADASVAQPVTDLNEATWRQRSNSGGFSKQRKMEQSVNEPGLPSDWVY